MYKHIITFLYWQSDIFTKFRYKLISINFKRLEQKRIAYLVSKHPNLKRCFEDKNVKKKKVYESKPEIKFYGKFLYLLTSHNKFKIVQFYS